MTRRNRTLRLIATLVVLAGTLVSLIAPAIPVQAQDEADSAARPPEFPIEIVLEDRYFLFDREIPIALEGLVEVGQQDDLTFYAETAEGPHDRVFVSSPGDEATVARYLPEIPVGADGTALANACPAQPQEFGDLQSGDEVYAYAGSEPDIPLDGLASIASTAEGFTVYADAAQQPPLDLLMDTGSDVVRFILLDDEGRPPVLGETLQFQGVPFAFEGDVAESRGTRDVRAGRLRGSIPAFRHPSTRSRLARWTSSTPRSVHASFPIAPRMLRRSAPPRHDRCHSGRS